VRLVASRQNLGFGAAVNQVAGQSDTPWLAIANADITLTPGALDALLSAAYADPNAGAIAPRLVLPDGSTQHSVFSFPTLASTLAINLGLDRLLPSVGKRLMTIGRWDPDRPARVPWAVAAFLLVRREAWDQVGGFDEEQWMYAEDLDLGWRLARAGWKTRYEPGALVHHQSAASTTQAWGDERTQRWQRSTYAWLLRRRGWLRTRLIAAINVAGMGARWAALTPAAWVSPVHFAGRRARARWWARLHASGLAPTAVLRRHDSRP
jgi:GT2 family glycosyltransferase